MKKYCKILCVILAIIACCLTFTACTNPNDNDGEVTPVALTNATPSSDNQTLLEYMEQCEIDFTIESGMITAIKGTSNTTNSFWMLYTSDAENSNEAWGTYDYEGTTLGSATLGAGELIVKAGCTYVWVYQTF